MGVQLARGFPPRSKWTYREVFHPAVVPPPPFIKLFLVQFILMGKCVCHSCSNKCIQGLRFQGLGFWVSVFIECQVLEPRFLGHRIFGSWVFLVVSFWVLGYFRFGFNGPRLLLNVHSQSLGSGSQDFQVLGFSGLGKFLVLRFLGVKV